MSQPPPTPRHADRRAALQARMATRRAAIQERLDARTPRRRRWPWAVAAGVLLLLLWAGVPQCHCVAVPPKEAPLEPGVLPSSPLPAETAAPAAPLPDGTIASRSRPEMPVPIASELPWLEALELQVSARSPRLAACFEGAARPGALRWTAAVEPTRGTVSDVEVVPVLQSDPLTTPQRTCVLDVLAVPPYRLETAERPSAPSRVRIVIEF